MQMNETCMQNNPV